MLLAKPKAVQQYRKEEKGVTRACRPTRGAPEASVQHARVVRLTFPCMRGPLQFSTFLFPAFLFLSFFSSFFSSLPKSYMHLFL